jgi:hypothetical protein
VVSGHGAGGATTGTVRVVDGTTGTVRVVHGTTIYVDTTDGNVVTVKTDGRTSVATARKGTPADLRAGRSIAALGATTRPAR